MKEEEDEQKEDRNKQTNRQTENELKRNTLPDICRHALEE